MTKPRTIVIYKRSVHDPSHEVSETRQLSRFTIYICWIYAILTTVTDKAEKGDEILTGDVSR